MSASSLFLCIYSSWQIIIRISLAYNALSFAILYSWRETGPTISINTKQRCGHICIYIITKAIHRYSHQTTVSFRHGSAGQNHVSSRAATETILPRFIIKNHILHSFSIFLSYSFCIHLRCLPPVLLPSPLFFPFFPSVAWRSFYTDTWLQPAVSCLTPHPKPVELLFTWGGGPRVATLLSLNKSV